MSLCGSCSDRGYLFVFISDSEFKDRTYEVTYLCTCLNGRFKAEKHPKMTTRDGRTGAQLTQGKPLATLVPVKSFVAATAPSEPPEVPQLKLDQEDDIPWL